MRIKLTPIARGLRRRQTEAEMKLWHQLRNRAMDGIKFRRQVPRGSYVADFLCDEAMLIIEVDGSQHAEQISDDANRDAYLRGLGYEVMRFWNADVMTNLDGVLEAIYAMAAARRKPPHPNPLPKGRGKGHNIE